MIDPAVLRRRVGIRLYNNIKLDQQTMNRFEVAVKYELSLVSVRFAFQSQTFQEFQELVKIGVKRSRKRDTGEGVHKIPVFVEDTNYEPEYVKQNWTIK